MVSECEYCRSCIFTRRCVSVLAGGSCFAGVDCFAFTSVGMSKRVFCVRVDLPFVWSLNFCRIAFTVKLLPTCEWPRNKHLLDYNPTVYCGILMHLACSCKEHKNGGYQNTFSCLVWHLVAAISVCSFRQRASKGKATLAMPTKNIFNKSQNTPCL